MKHTIVIKRNGVLRKIAKVIFGDDGSYYVTVPYHQANKAVLMKSTVDYDASTPRHVDDLSPHISKTEMIDLGVADSDRVKLSHHPDGFVQFSGHGVLSGRNVDGSPKGVGALSTPLGSKFDGPAFAIGLTTLEDFPEITKLPSDIFLLDADNIYAIPGCSGLVIDAHYFPPMWNRFIRRSQDHAKDSILLRHPCTAVVELSVLRMPVTCAIPGFFGFEMFSMPITDREIASGKNKYPHFSLAGPAGNLRKNDKGHMVADALNCIYPRENMDNSWLARNLNFTKAEPINPLGKDMKDTPEE